MDIIKILAVVVVIVIVLLLLNACRLSIYSKELKKANNKHIKKENKDNE